MIKNRKGFTLVELLAVIVILAIILAIAIPGITGIISNAKVSAFESDAKMIITGIEYAAMEADVTGGTPPDIGDISTTLDDYGADPSNYDHVYIIYNNPYTICVESASSSEFGAFSAVSTKSTVYDLSEANADTEYENDDSCADVITRVFQ